LFSIRRETEAGALATTTPSRLALLSTAAELFQTVTEVAVERMRSWTAGSSISAALETALGTANRLSSVLLLALTPQSSAQMTGSPLATTGRGSGPI
jgi:hypothetical protein